MGYALITGASSGIGLELARIMATKGHDLILVARSDSLLQSIKTDLTSGYSVDVQVIAADLALDSAAEQLYAETTKRGLIVDYLINNAGFGDCCPFLESEWERQEQMVQLNITSLMRLTQLYGREMKERDFGRILNVSSVAAFAPGPYMANYYATKAHVLSFSQAVNQELRGTNVSVTALCPGPTATGFERNAQIKGAKSFTMLKNQSAKSVAELGYRAMIRGQACARHGLFTKFMNLAARLSPSGLSTRVVAWLNKNR